MAEGLATFRMPASCVGEKFEVSLAMISFGVGFVVDVVPSAHIRADNPSYRLSRDSIGTAEPMPYCQ